jgi:hypothetical protein
MEQNNIELEIVSFTSIPTPALPHLIILPLPLLERVHRVCRLPAAPRSPPSAFRRLLVQPHEMAAAELSHGLTGVAPRTIEKLHLLWSAAAVAAVVKEELARRRWVQ